MMKGSAATAEQRWNTDDQAHRKRYSTILLRLTDFSAYLAVGEIVILLHPPLPVLGVSMGMERERLQNDSLANGYTCRSTGHLKLSHETSIFETSSGGAIFAPNL